MKKLTSKIFTRAKCSTLPLFVIGAIAPFHAMAAATVTLAPGANIQSAVTAAPAGTNFILQAGTYRGQSIIPKANDHFTGQGIVDLNGSQVLSFTQDPATGLWVATAPADSTQTGQCDSLHPLCGYNQDLFIDSTLQTPQASLTGLPEGSWYFNRSTGTVYVPNDPTGHVIEIGMQKYAIYGTVAGVQITDIIVEKYATPAHAGAIGGSLSGASWIVNGVEARYNHGGGIFLGSGSQLINSYIHHNGQLGIDLQGLNPLVRNNEISWNNYAGFSGNWESGGSKFWATTNMLVQSNYVHDNNGKGLWTDTDNVGTTYVSNTVVNNAGVGIQHEVSYAAVIRNNVVKGNSPAPTTWLGNAQIRVMSSSNVEIYGNVVETAATGGNGIAVYNQTRGTGTLGPWVSANCYVHNNTITYLGTTGESGFQNDGDATQAVGNRFDYNHYVLGNSGINHWFWYSWRTWSLMKSAGQEAHGYYN
jgi:hypothetical protein